MEIVYKIWRIDIMSNIGRKALGHTIWFKIILTILIFLPPHTQIAYDPAKSTEVIAAVMSHPLVTSINWLLPIAKLLLLFVVILPVISNRFSQRFLLGYYSFILLVVGILQNISFTENYGFVWLVGNTLVQITVLVYCTADVIKNKTVIQRENISKNRLWVLIPMALALLMPYSVDSLNRVFPSFTAEVLLNESGVTYCMITPVILGIILLFSKGVHKPTLSVISYVGFIFGLLNMLTWFGMQRENWWMGVLHLPLLILSFYGLLVARKEKIA